VSLVVDEELLLDRIVLPSDPPLRTDTVGSACAGAGRPGG
jgi:hypothetical protein